MPQSSKKFKCFFFQVLWQSQKISTLLRCLLRLTFHSSFTSDLLLIRVCFGQKLIVCVVGKFSRLLPWLYSTNLFECFTFPDSLTTLYSQFILSLPPKQFLSQTKNKLAINLIHYWWSNCDCNCKRIWEKQPRSSAFANRRIFYLSAYRMPSELLKNF